MTGYQPHLWIDVVNPEVRMIQLVHSGRAGFVAGPFVKELIQVFWQVAPYLLVNLINILREAFLYKS